MACSIRIWYRPWCMWMDSGARRYRKLCIRNAGVRKVNGVDAVVSSTDAVVTLSWSESPGAQLYGVLRADQENGAYQWLSAVSGTSFQDITAHPEKTYYYKIYGAVSVGGVGKNGENSDVFSVYVPRDQEPWESMCLTIMEPSTGPVWLSPR